jgi:uncharacterized protein (TIGR02246 family)
VTTTIDTTPILDVLHRLDTAWAAGDADAFAAEYVEDATVVLPGIFHQGRAAVRDYMARGFAGPLRGSRALDEPRDIRVLGADTAIVVSRTGFLTAGEQELPADRERTGTWVLTRQDGRWLVAAFANAATH